MSGGAERWKSQSRAVATHSQAVSARDCRSESSFDPARHLRKVDALRCKVLHAVPGEALTDFRNARCIRRAFECLLVDEGLRIAFVEDVRLFELYDIVVEDFDAGRVAVRFSDSNGVGAVGDDFGLSWAKRHVEGIRLNHKQNGG